MPDEEKTEENKKLIKLMTKEELALYRHEAYLKRKDKDKARQKCYYSLHREEILKKAKLRYRKKCGL